MQIERDDDSLNVYKWYADNRDGEPSDDASHWKSIRQIWEEGHAHCPNVAHYFPFGYAFCLPTYHKEHT